jgi:hypothetical protein
MAIKLFFSYSHKDEALRDQLEIQLAMLKRQGLIEAWHDRRIVAGSKLDGAISDKLEEADLILLLVSPDFIASDYCYDVEMTRALERHHAKEARVIPVILRPCDWHSAPFGGLLAAPRDGKAITKWPDIDEAFLDVVTAIRGAIQETPATAFPSRTSAAPTRASPPSPSPSTISGPRSSNLRLRRTFTDADKDAFLEEGFEYIARFFEGSLDELRKRNPGVEGRFRRIDARHFSAVAYRQGKAVARCRIWFGGGRSMLGGIAYSMSDSEGDNSYNESLSVVETEQALYLRPLGMASGFSGGREAHLTMDGAAELYWAMFIEPLQR